MARGKTTGNRRSGGNRINGMKMEKRTTGEEEKRSIIVRREEEEKKGRSIRKEGRKR